MKKILCALLICFIGIGICSCANNTTSAPEKEMYQKLEKYLPQKVLDNLPDFKQEDVEGNTLYLWSKWDNNTDSFVHKIEVMLNDDYVDQYHYKNYSFELDENKITKEQAYGLVESFAKDFIKDGGQLTFENKPAYPSLYDPDHVESWVAVRDKNEYVVMVNLDYGYVEFFKIFENAE